MIDLEYLQNYQSKLFSYLCKLFYIKKELICCFLDKEYSYSVRDRSRRVYFIFLSEIITNNVEVKLDQNRKILLKLFPHPFAA